MFHYTVLAHYEAISRDQLIRPTTEGVPDGERPAVWFSVHPIWEQTATKALRDRETGEIHRATWQEMEESGPVRIEVEPAAAPHRWKDYLRLSGVPPASVRGLERAAREWRANPLHWRISFEPVGVENWLAVEIWSGSRWMPVNESDRVLPAKLLDDPRFAFIAKTHDEWRAFRDAEIILGRDRTNGTNVIVFGRARLESARLDGNEDVEALAVQFDPDSDELDRLAAVCVVLKGRHELT